MASKNELILAVIGVAIVGFIVYYFFLRNKTQSTSTSSTSSSPLSAIGSDVGSFVSGVQNAFSKVLSAGGSAVNSLSKDVGWGEKELGNTVGIISTGASVFGKTVATDTEHFVNSVENVFSNVGKTLSTGVSTIAKDIEGAGAQTEKTVESIPSSLAKIFKLPTPTISFGKLESGVSKAPKEIMSGVKSISTGVESGVNGFINDVRSLFSRF